MPFILEKVPEADIERCGLREINKKAWKVDHGYEWVIDRDRDIYLRFVSNGDRDEPYRADFNFYWKGVPIWVRFEKHAEGVRGGRGATTWEFWGWQPPPELLPEKDDILAAMKEALIVYKDYGIYSCIADHQAFFKNF